jgi:hypothetical protein
MHYHSHAVSFAALIFTITSVAVLQKEQISNRGFPHRQFLEAEDTEFHLLCAAALRTTRPAGSFAIHRWIANNVFGD